MPSSITHAFIDDPLLMAFDTPGFDEPILKGDRRKKVSQSSFAMFLAKATVEERSPLEATRLPTKLISRYAHLY